MCISINFWELYILANHNDVACQFRPFLHSSMKRWACLRGSSQPRTKNGDRAEELLLLHSLQSTWDRCTIITMHIDTIPYRSWLIRHGTGIHYNHHACIDTIPYRSWFKRNNSKKVWQTSFYTFTVALKLMNNLCSHALINLHTNNYRVERGHETIMPCTDGEMLVHGY